MKPITRALLVASCAGMIAAAALPFLQVRRVTVSSDDGRREYRRVDTDGYVRLVKRLSDKPCIQGRSWGYDRNGIWVDDGCRATFEYGDRDRWDDRDRNRGRDRWTEQDEFRLESSDGRYKSKNVDTRGGVRLIRRLSDKPCIQGRSWGYDRNRVWVNHGCRAIFEIGRRRGW
jgi:hypothetical protein